MRNPSAHVSIPRHSFLGTTAVLVQSGEQVHKVFLGMDGIQLILHEGVVFQMPTTVDHPVFPQVQHPPTRSIGHPNVVFRGVVDVEVETKEGGVSFQASGNDVMTVHQTFQLETCTGVPKVSSREC